MAAGGISEGFDTETSLVQKKAEQDVIGCFKAFMAGIERSKSASAGDEDEDDDISLNRDMHRGWLQRALMALPANFSGLDASRPWFCFWISHSLEMLDAYDTSFWAPKIGAFLGACQHQTGGFGGGPMQLAHLAPTYAAVSAIVIGGDEVAYRAVDREKTYRFLMRVKHPHGGFMMHDEGETDMRGTYCAMAVASMLHILTDELVEGVPEYVRRCQTFEGGIAGEEGLEAHGGYAYCGLAALCIIGKAHVLDLELLLNWASHRQMSLEGGFQGRTNKLVDSCYNFWMGAIFPLIHEAFRQQGGDIAATLPTEHLWFAPGPLQTYTFLACQHPGGGLRDKPGKSADYYHTCYSLSGTAICQHGLNNELCIVGSEGNCLKRTDMFYNVLLEKSARKTAYFAAQPPFTIDGREIGGSEGEGVVKAREHFAVTDIDR